MQDYQICFTIGSPPPPPAAAPAPAPSFFQLYGVMIGGIAGILVAIALLITLVCWYRRRRRRRLAATAEIADPSVPDSLSAGLVSNQHVQHVQPQ